MGSGRDLFSQQINKPSTEGDFEATGCGEPGRKEGVQEVMKGLCLSRVSEVLLGKYNYPGIRVSPPILSEKNQNFW